VLLDEKELAVRRLPQQKIRESLFPARADDDVRVWHIGAPERGPQRILSHRFPSGLKRIDPGNYLRASSI
jgi:hypothetical protein